MRTQLLITLFVTLLGAGCAPAAPPQAADLPTLVELPTLTATATGTLVIPSATVTASDTPTATPTATLSVTPSATITETSTPTATSTATATLTPSITPDNEGIQALALLALQATVLPQATFTPAVAGPAIIQAPPGTAPAATCVYLPPGGFGAVFSADPTLNAQMGCPLGAPPVTTSAASAAQNYERGAMVWLAGPPSAIYVLTSAGRFQRYDDTYNAATDPVSGGETPPSGLFEPVRGFGKVWRTFPDVRTGLGWAINEEVGGQATLLMFERGLMLHLTQRGDVLILVFDAGGLSGAWRALPGSP